MIEAAFRSGLVETARRCTARIEAGPEHGSLMIFLHGWPEIGLFRHKQFQHFGEGCWRCIAPDMRGYTPHLAAIVEA